MNPKRIALTIVATATALLLLATAVLPYWFGWKAEKSYHVMLDQMSRVGWLRFTNKNYQRGWLSSTAETVIRQPELPFEIIARHRISHGPFPWDRILAGEWRLTPVQARITSEVFVAEPATGKPWSFPPLTAETTFRLNGSGAVHGEIPPVRKTTARKQVVDWRGLSGDMSFDREWKKILLDVRMPVLSVTSPEHQGDLSVSKISLHSDMREGVAGYYFGDGAFTVNRIEMNGAAGRIGVQGLDFSSTTRPAADNVDMELRYKLADVHTADAHFGPAQLIIEVRHLDAASLVKFKNEIDRISFGNMPPPQAALILAGKTMTLLGALSKKNPELEITHLSFKTPEGEISGQGKFVLDGRRRDIAQNPMQLLTALSGHFGISFPKAALKRMLTPMIRRDIEALRQSGGLSPGDMAKLDPQTMAQIVDQAFPQYLERNEFTRLLVEDNGIYKLDLSIRRGQLLINGQPWHVPSQVAFTP